jgi:hypothetical protein
MTPSNVMVFSIKYEKDLFLELPFCNLYSIQLSAMTRPAIASHCNRLKYQLAQVIMNIVYINIYRHFIIQYYTKPLYFYKIFAVM